MRGGRNRLSAADIALWREVSRTVKPLPGRAAIEQQQPPEPPPAQPQPLVALPTGVGAPPTPSKPALAPIAPLEKRLRVRLKRGREEVGAKIDLHGMRQDEAHAALSGFLRREQARGSAVVLVVTGKGAAGPAPLPGLSERGVLRRVVPHWLALPDLRSIVLGFAEADLRHGGGGALYVRLRRTRQP